MTQWDYKEKFDQKVERNYGEFLDAWANMTPEALIEQVEKMAATHQAYTLLMGVNYNPEYYEYLLRFENPLEVVRDKWFEEQYWTHSSDEMHHALWSIWDQQDASQDYALDSEYTQERDGGMKLC